MRIVKQKLKAKALSMAMTALMLLPLATNAQYDESKYGIQSWGKTGLMGKQGSSNGDDGLSLQGFGENQDGITLQNFGETAPLGSGWLVLMGTGLGYAAMKQRKNNKKQTK